MKNTAHSARQFAFCCVTTVLTAMLAVMTVLPPERVPLAPLLVAMLLRPALLLVTAGVNFGCLKTGVHALFSGKPDRHTAAVLTVLLALVLCTLGVCPDAPVTAALLLTASAWLDLLEQRLEAGLPDAPPTRTAEAVWAWAGFAAAVCAAAVWAALGAGIGAVLIRALCVLAASTLCPFRLITLLADRSALRHMSVPAVSAQTLEALGMADTALICPEGLLTGNPTVSALRPAGMEEGQFLALAASIVQSCDAPESRAILTAAQDRGLTLLPAEACTQTPEGFCAVLDGKRYYAGISEQLRRRGIFSPRADDVSLSGKTALLLGMEGGLYLGLIALQSPLLSGASEAVRALAAQRLRPVLPTGSQPLYTRQLAVQAGAQTIEAASPEQALTQLAQKGRPVCIQAGEPCAYLQTQTPVLLLQTLSDAPEVISVCRRAVRTRRGLQGLGAVCAFLLTGVAGGLLAPALDAGARPALCALLACCLTALTILPALSDRRTGTAAERAAEDQPPQSAPSAPEPPEPAASSRTLTIRMDELPAVPGKAVLEQALLDVPGVRTAEADYETGLILITGTAEKESLLQAIAEATEA